MVVRALASSVVLRQVGEQEGGDGDGARLHACHSRDRLQKCAGCSQSQSSQEVATVSPSASASQAPLLDARDEQRASRPRVLQVQFLRHAGRHCVDRLQQHAQRHEEGQRRGRLKV